MAQRERGALLARAMVLCRYWTSLLGLGLDFARPIAFGYSIVEIAPGYMPAMKLDYILLSLLTDASEAGRKS